MISLLLVGCGKMGSALIERWKQQSVFAHFHIVDPHHAHKNELNVSWHKHLESLPPETMPGVIVFAVKPQQLASVLPDYRIRFAAANPLYISVAAGKNLAFYAAHLGEYAHIVRAMPNTPALVGQGMSVLCSAPTLPATARKLAGDLMKAVGKVEWLADEGLMDAVTALSGCGPAYVFLFADSMVSAGVAAGLPEAMAKELAVQTIAGSVALAGQSLKSLEELRIEVASPGGATEAALAVLMAEGAMEKLMSSAIAAAKKRSEEIS